MADAKITELTEVLSSEVNLGDVMPIVNNTVTKKITLSTLFGVSSATVLPQVQPTIDIVDLNAPDWTDASTAVFANSATWTSHTDLSGNVTVGETILTALTGGYKNTAVGVRALSSDTTGSGNVAVGYQALTQNSTGSGNTAIGYNAGYANVIGINNTYIGNQATGHCADESNTITLGNNSIKTLRCQAATITSLSDERDKKEVEPLEIGLDFIKELEPVSFNWAARDGSKADEKDTGFIAQDLLSAQVKLGQILPGLVDESNSEKLEASYSKLIPVLVRAIQELSAELDEIKKSR